MTIGYVVALDYQEDELILTYTFPDGKKETRRVALEEISEIKELCQNLPWGRTPAIAQKIGQRLFALLDSTSTLTKALKEADAHGEPLHLSIQYTANFPELDFPFELLYHSAFLVPRKIHLVRQVSAYAHKKEPEPQNRALKILFVACSPQGVSVLDFEEEEEAIFDITRNLPVDMDVEDTGSLKGLETQLEYSEYDIIHLTGHADIDEEGPYFCMETEEGFKDKVRPAQLWEILKKGASSPRLLFLSGCRTGQTPRAAFSFAHSLVAEHGPPVVGWGLPVSDPAAIEAAKKLYHELGRGKSITDAVFSARQELFENKQPDWSLLRLFCDGTPLNIPIVKKGQKKKVKPRDIQYVYLEKSKVIVLKRGFVGRRRQIQAGIRCLKSDEGKIGLLLYGTGGLGKSCLAGKFCERFKDHTLVIVHGELNKMTLLDALEDAFIRADDEKGQEILKESEKIPFKVRRLCSSVFKERNYLILLDDFEKNLKGVEEGNIVVSDEAAPILAVLLQYLGYAGKMTQIIITSRYQFPFTVNGEDLLHQLALIGLTSFRGADERKKVADLTSINEYPKKKVRQKLIEAGRGNPRLMETLNSLIETEQALDAESLLNGVRGKQDEFVQELLLRRILKRQSEDFQRVLQYSAVYRLPVTREGIEEVCKKVEHWNEFLGLAVRLSLVEEGRRGDKSYYQVTPLLSEEVFTTLEESEEKMCHQAAVEYYQKVILTDKGYESDYGFELIDHALKCGNDEAAVEEGGRLLSYLRNILAYEAALYEGRYIYSQIAGIKKDKKYSRFLFEFGWILDDIGKLREAVGCYKQALSIDKEVYGERHPAVARDLNNLGGAWNALGDAQKAITYFEQALSIGKEVYGERHPAVATRLNNLGSAWRTLGDAQKAITYYEQALSIGKEVYGERHPAVATRLNNLGGAWNALGDAKKAITYYEQALSIDKEVYGERHPAVARDLNNLGGAWNELGDAEKAITYYEQALSIDKEVYGERHPAVARDLNNLGGAWNELGDAQKAITYIQQAHDIFQEFYGDHHPHTEITKEWLDNLK